MTKQRSVLEEEILNEVEGTRRTPLADVAMSISGYALFGQVLGLEGSKVGRWFRGGAGLLGFPMIIVGPAIASVVGKRRKKREAELAEVEKRFQKKATQCKRKLDDGCIALIRKGSGLQSQIAEMRADEAMVELNTKLLLLTFGSTPFRSRSAAVAAGFAFTVTHGDTALKQSGFSKSRQNLAAVIRRYTASQETWTGRQLSWIDALGKVIVKQSGLGSSSRLDGPTFQKPGNDPILDWNTKAEGGADSRPDMPAWEQASVLSVEPAKSQRSQAVRV